GRAVQHSLAVLDRGADRDELGHVLPPLVAADVEPHADNPVGAELVRLLLHTRHRQLARRVHRLGEHRHLLAFLPAGHLDSDVVDRAADDKAQRLEAGLLDEEELVHRQVGGEKPGAVLLRARAPRLGHALQRCRVIGALGRFAVAHGEIAPSVRSMIVLGLGNSFAASWRIAVPIALKLITIPFCPPPRTVWSMRTPTTPSACSAAACAVTRAIVVSRASYTH